MAKARVLFLTDRSDRHQRAALKYAPPDLEVLMKRRPAKADLMALLPTVEFLISERNIPVTGEMLAVAEQLKLIVRLGSLTYDIDRDAARSMGIRISAQPVMETVLMAEHLVMMTLAVLKHLGRSIAATAVADHRLPARRTDENTFAFNWMNYPDIGRLFGKTVAIVGMGESGVELSRRLKPFHVRQILYNKRTRYPKAVERELGVEYADLADCMKQADVLILLLPYSQKTDRMINADLLALMKTEAIIVHAGSGSVLDEQALAEALRAGKLAGAALDTFEFEPLQPTHSLIRLARDPRSNLLLTPHVGGASVSESRADDFAEIMRFLEGAPLLFEVK